MGRALAALKNHCKKHRKKVSIDFQYDNTFFTATFKKNKENLLKDSGEKMPLKMPLKTPLKILEMLADNPNMTIPELAEQIERSESATKRAVRNLQKSGHIKRIGSKKSGHWKVIKK